MAGVRGFSGDVFYVMTRQDADASAAKHRLQLLAGTKRVHIVRALFSSGGSVAASNQQLSRYASGVTVAAGSTSNDPLNGGDGSVSVSGGVTCRVWSGANSAAPTGTMNGRLATVDLAAAGGQFDTGLLPKGYFALAPGESLIWYCGVSGANITVTCSIRFTVEP